MNFLTFLTLAGTLTLELVLYWRGCATGAFVAALPAKGAWIAQPVVTTGSHSHAAATSTHDEAGAGPQQATPRTARSGSSSRQAFAGAHK